MRAVTEVPALAKWLTLIQRWLLPGLLLLTCLFTSGGPLFAGEDDWTLTAYERGQLPMPGLPLLPKIDATITAAQSRARIALGRKLFFDRRLSLNGTMSCGMCHVPEQAFTNNELSVAIGINGKSARRNAPTLINVGYYETLFLDGRDHRLETQFFSPLLAANEMANPSVGHVIAKLKNLSPYPAMFDKAFGPGANVLTPDHIGLSLAAYQRTLLAGASRFDQWRFGGQPDALTARERQGFELFVGRAGCVNCHRIGDTDAIFTDQQFHDTGYGWMREQQRQHPGSVTRVELAPGQFVSVASEIIDSVGLAPPKDLGRYEVTLKPDDLWRFRTPQLRNVALTAPYMHDGGFRTLAQVLDFYNRGGAAHPAQSRLIKPLGLTSPQLRALQAFLLTLTSTGLEQLVKEARVARPDSPAD